MAGREQKAVGRTDVTFMDYDKFVKECNRPYFMPDAHATVEDHRGRDRKITVKGTGWCEGFQAEVVLDPRFIEVSAKITSEIVYLAGNVNRDMLVELMHDPTGPVGMEKLTRTDRTRDLDISAMRVGGRPPYIVVRANSVAGLRRIFEWLFGVPMDFEVPRLTSKRARHAA
jgi:hypothetical protein